MKQLKTKGEDRIGNGSVTDPFPSELRPTNYGEFQEAIAGSPGQLIVIDFFATWCPPCKAIAPLFESLAEKYKEVVFYKIDVDENEETTAMCGVEAMPTFLFYKNGEQLHQIIGGEGLEAKIVDNQF